MTRTGPSSSLKLELKRYNQRKQAGIGEVLTVVRAIRDVLLQRMLPFPFEKDKKVMDVIRIGILRVTPGVQLIDEAVRVRTTSQ